MAALTTGESAANVDGKLGSMSNGFENRRVIIFGATSGIGSAVERCLAGVSEKHSRADGVVNCAGSLLLKPAHLTIDAEWAAVLGANLSSAFHILRSATARMMKTGGGSIVLLSSAVSQRGMINHEAIAAAKAGGAGLALSAAATDACYNIRSRARTRTVQWSAC